MFICISLRVFHVFVVQPLKSDWKGAPVKGSIEELSRLVRERGRQVGAC